MKKLIIILTLFTLLSIEGNTKPKSQYQYRPAPKLGEILYVSGFVMLGVSAIAYKQRPYEPTVIIGYALCFVGFAIDLDSRKGNDQTCHKIRKFHKSLFASGGGMGLNIKF